MKTKNRRTLVLLLSSLLALAAALGGWLWYDNNVDRSGWAEKDGVRFYRDFHADPVSGWLDLPDGRYYFQEDGTPSTGWQVIEDDTYYFTGLGPMHTGWLNLDELTYYFYENGMMASGWLWLGDAHYYLDNGSLYTGWQTIDGKTYYFNENGIAALDFTQIDGKTYHFTNEGMSTGETVVGDRTFLFQEDGVLLSGWQEEGEHRRYYLDNGFPADGWQDTDEGRKYFNGGIYVTGWLKLGEYDYYLHPDGSPAIGPTKIDGQTHYFTPKGIEVILVNALNAVPSYYQTDLVNVTSWHDVDRRCYDALVQMLADCNAAGIEYNFNSAYRTIAEQTAILEARTEECMKAHDLSFEEASEMALETVAYPGTSEHHLGLAVDLLGYDAIAWLTEHCWDYGFIVRYTAEKEPYTGIIDEPWHFRYVGTEVSLDMKDSGLCLEEYLGAEPVNP